MVIDSTLKRRSGPWECLEYVRGTTQRATLQDTRSNDNLNDEDNNCHY